MTHLNVFFKPVRRNLVAFFLFLALWSVLSGFFEPYIVPSPLTVVKDIGTLCDTVFMENIGISAGRVLTGFCVSFALGTVIGILSVTLKISTPVETILVLFQVTPGLILGVIFLLIFGVGSMAPICLIITLTTPLIAINTSNALLKKNPLLHGVIRSFNGGFRHLLLDLYLPALIPTMKTNITMGLVMSLKILLLGEFIASENGIGYLLNLSKMYFNMEAVFFYLFVILLLLVGFQIIVNCLFVLFFKKYLYPD